MNSIIAWNNQKAITTEQFLNDVYTVADYLPDANKAINLCSNRYAFLVSFCAIIIRHQTNILPPNQLPEIINTLIPVEDDTYCITDKAELSHSSAQTNPIPLQHKIDLKLKHDCILFPELAQPTQSHPLNIPYIAEDLICAITYTSGSTGTPKPQFKRWRSLFNIAHKTQQSLAQYQKGTSLTLLATVPSQHMFGLETSIMLPLQAGHAMHDQQPFFPETIKEILTQIPGHKALITTPMHIKSCVENKLEWPPLDFILSATAPLPSSLATQAEHLFNTSALEIYGCSEAGTIATRQCTKNPHWNPIQGIKLNQTEHKILLTSDDFDDKIFLPDRIKIHNDGYFELLGRNENNINIGGKRTTLEELNVHLNAIHGVVDGTFFLPDEDNQKTTRLLAFVVTDELNSKQITKALRLKIDALFLPRPIYIVNSLPRSATGKLPRKSLLNLLKKVTLK
ncbi:MAG: acyl--CoA ligase [Methylococcales bacterium]|nr:acyl--CoA ligase [Methylococcales bacterium]MBT7410722.1 acyl--CoA ligase [Methylococcales bacterium]